MSQICGRGDITGTVLSIKKQERSDDHTLKYQHKPLRLETTVELIILHTHIHVTCRMKGQTCKNLHQHVALVIILRRSESGIDLLIHVTLQKATECISQNVELGLMMWRSLYPAVRPGWTVRAHVCSFFH